MLICRVTFAMVICALVVWFLVNLSNSISCTNFITKLAKYTKKQHVYTIFLFFLDVVQKKFLLIWVAKLLIRSLNLGIYVLYMLVKRVHDCSPRW